MANGTVSDFNLQKLNTKQLAENIKATIEFGGSLFVAGRRGCGKMLSLDTDIPTPTGFVKLKELQVNDEIFDEQGDICKVVALHPIDEKPVSYRLTFDEGSTVDACKDHLWLTWDKRARKAYGTGPNPTIHPAIRTTEQIANTVKTKTLKYVETNHSIPCAKALSYREQTLLIDPYVLGIWLGDGTTAKGEIECADDEILTNISEAGYFIRPSISSYTNKSKSMNYGIGEFVDNDLPRSDGNCLGGPIGRLRKELVQLNVLGHKHIPLQYLVSSCEQRLALLQGLMDSDGCCNAASNRMEYCSVLPELANDVLILAKSLGIKATIHRNESWLHDKQCKDRYRVSFSTMLPVFRLPRKLANMKKSAEQMNRSTHRYIVDVKLIDPVPMRCITVDSPNGLFLITKSFIPTHNTQISKQVIAASKKREVYLNASTFDRCDMSGFPKLLGDQKDEFVRFLLPDYYRHLIEGTEPCVVLFDEIDKTDASVLAPLLEFIQLHTINGRGLKNLNSIIMTGNLIAEGGQRPALPLLDRAEKYLVEGTLNHFLDWGAETGEIHPSVAAYLNDHPDDLFGDVDPGDVFADASQRGWHNASKILRFGEAHKWSKEVLKTKVGGCLGKKIGVKYSTYFDHYVVLLPIVERIMKGTIPAEFTKLEPSKQMVACMIVCARTAREIDNPKTDVSSVFNVVGKFLQIVDPEMALIAIRSQIGLPKLISINFEKHPEFDAVLERLRKRLCD